MNTKLATLMLTAITVMSAEANDSPLWLRNPSIAPDGKQIAFTYQGDIYTVSPDGGKAQQLTNGTSYNTYPIWSPDSRQIVFASDREGSLDLYIIDADGGTPRRLTTNTATERPMAFLNDSTILYATAGLSTHTAYQPGERQVVYTVSTKGGRPRIFASVPILAMSINSDGRILYQDRKGVEDPLRKHEHSSSTHDIWLIDNGKYTKLTNYNGHDQQPVWVKGTDTYYYVSEQDSTLNVYVRGLDGKEQQLTHHRKHPVRSLSASDNGLLAYTWDGELYTLRPGGEPKKVDITINNDNYTRDLVKGYRTGGASNMAVTPSGEEVAFVLRGDIYVTPIEYTTTKRITNTDGQEREIDFAPDGRSLVYDSERDGLWQIFISKIKDEEDKTFSYATEIIEEPLYKSDKAAQQPRFSPDGKKVAFLEDRTTLKVIDLETKEVNTALDGKYNYSYSDGDVEYEWSPDSRWFLVSYIGTGGWNNPDIALVSADGTQVIDLTESGYANGSPKWVLDGKGITYTSGRYGYRSHGSWGEENDVILMMLDGEGWDEFNMTEEEVALKEKATDKDKDKGDEATEKKSDKKKGKKGKNEKTADKEDTKPLKFDLDNRNYRTRRLTANSSRLTDYWLSKKGDKLYYISQATEGGNNLMVADLKKGGTRVLVKGIGRSGILTDKKGESIYLLTGSGMKKVDLASGEEKPISFEALYTRHPSAERQYIFDHTLSQVKDKFYDVNLHGVDWEDYGKEYSRYLPYINNNYDFAEMLSELLGELNASHTGAGYYAPGAAMPTASLGVFIDEDYEGDGIKVKEIIARGPLYTTAADVAAGDVILAIDGERIAAGADYYPMLEGKAGKKVRLQIQKADGESKTVDIRPQGSMGDLLYQRWVEHNEQVVDSLSGGQIGYVHVRAMDSDSFREVYSKLLGKYRNCDAVVVDTRYNTGGWLHNDIAQLLSGKEYVRYSPRGQYIGSDPFSQWTKPSVMLVNEVNYSDAHATPYVYKTLGIGKLVGAPVPGTMTAVWWEDQIDPTLLFGIPEVTSLDRMGVPLENQQLNPDVIIYNNPADEQQGIDTQLIEAVKMLMTR